MKRRNIYCAVLLLFSVTACTVDYDAGPSSVKEIDRIVINAYLNPNRPIRIQIYESGKKDNGYVVRGLTNSHFTLKEDETTLFDGTCPDSIFEMRHYPKADSKYFIEVSHERLPTVKAETSVPKAIQCVSGFSCDESNWDKSAGYIVRLKSFEFSQQGKESLWITSYLLYSNDTIEQYSEIYTNNALVDKTNSSAGMGVKNEVVGSIYYNGFLRIKNKNIPHLTEIALTPNYVMDGSQPAPQDTLRQTGIRVKLITASPEYDKYNKSLYEQKYMIVYDEDISSVFYQPKGVYGNIENGLGIFAGMNEANYSFDLPVEKK